MYYDIGQMGTSQITSNAVSFVLYITHQGVAVRVVNEHVANAMQEAGILACCEYREQG